MPFCPKCGKEIPEEANFCPACGYDVTQVKRLVDKTVTQPPPSKEQETPKAVDSQIGKTLEAKTHTPSLSVTLFLALVVGFFLMGLGHFYVGKKKRGAIFLVAGILFFVNILYQISAIAVFVQLILWIFQTYDALKQREKMLEFKSNKPSLSITFISSLIPGVGHFYIRKVWRGLLFLLATIILCFLIYMQNMYTLSALAVIVLVILWISQIYDALKQREKMLEIKPKVIETQTKHVIQDLSQREKKLETKPSKVKSQTRQVIPIIISDWIISFFFCYLITVFLAAILDSLSPDFHYIYFQVLGLGYTQLLLNIPISLICTYLLGVSQKCPSCKKKFARETVGKELIDVDEGYETVTRTDTIRDSSGDTIGTVDRDEQVHMIYETYKIYYKCIFCGFQWSEIKKESHEG